MIAVLSALIFAVQAAVAHPPPTVIGLWRTPTDRGLIRIETCGGAICGHVAGSARLTVEPGQTDVHNKDPARRGRAIKGLLMMKLNPQGPGRWGDGWIYNPNDGGTYKASIDLTPDGRLRLKGCVVAPLCQTQVWTRAG